MGELPVCKFCDHTEYSTILKGNHALICELLKNSELVNVLNNLIGFTDSSKSQFLISPIGCYLIVILL